jgi:hypothetical protein
MSPLVAQSPHSPNDSKRIAITWNAEIYDFDSSFVLPGFLVLPHDALSEQQLNTLKEDFNFLRFHDNYKELCRHPHLPQFETEEDIKNLRLICDHPHKQKRRNHLKNFLYFRKHNIYVPEWVTQQSLRHPAHVIESDSGLSYEWLCPDFKYYICKYPVTPHILENLHLLARKHPVNTGIDYRTGLRVFIHLSHEEQQEMIGYTSHQIKTIMDCDWYKTHESLRLLHLERVKKNVPLVEYQFVMKFENNGEIFTVSELICAMTQAEAEDFQAILDRTQFVILHSRHMGRSVLPIFGIFAYLYFKLGSENFSELLSYLRDCQNGSHEKKSIVKTLCDSTKLQELIIALSKQDCELPLSLRLELSDLDFAPYIDTSS